MKEQHADAAIKTMEQALTDEALEQVVGGKGALRPDVDGLIEPRTDDPDDEPSWIRDTRARRR